MKHIKTTNLHVKCVEVIISIPEQNHKEYELSNVFLKNYGFFKKAVSNMKY